MERDASVGTIQSSEANPTADKSVKAASCKPTVGHNGRKSSKQGPHY